MMEKIWIIPICLFIIGIFSIPVSYNFSNINITMDDNTLRAFEVESGIISLQQENKFLLNSVNNYKTRYDTLKNETDNIVRFFNQQSIDLALCTARLNQREEQLRNAN